MSEHKLLLKCPVHGMSEHVIPYPELGCDQSVMCSRCTEDWEAHHAAGKTGEFVRHAYVLRPEKNLLNRPLADEEVSEYNVKFEHGVAVMAVVGTLGDIGLLGGTWVKTKASCLEGAVANARKHMVSLKVEKVPKEEMLVAAIRNATEALAAGSNDAALDYLQAALKADGG